jgi:tripartite-type tricarboxylate transporter receptor subunit TctC
MNETARKDMLGSSVSRLGRAGSIALAAIAMVGIVAAPASAADDYPNKPIKLIVPYGAGTGADIMARQIEPGIRQQLKQPVIIENRPGAGAVLATEAVAAAAPDGYTLLFGATQTAINPHVYNLRFDTLKDLIPVVRVSNAPLILAVSKQLPVTSVAELVAYGKKNPGKLNYTSAGMGSSPHLAGAYFAALNGIQAVHVPSNNIPQAITDLIRGEIHFIFYPYVGIKGQIEAGDLRVLASTNATRTKFLKDAPTMVELGYKDFVLPAWQGIFVPKGTPKEIVDRIYRSVADSLGPDAKLAENLEKTGTEVKIESPSEFSAFVRRQLDVYAEIVKSAGLPRQ